MVRTLGGLILLALAGCAAQPDLIRQTGSGKAEATFAGVTVDEVRNALTLSCSKMGKEVATDTHSVTCSQLDKGGRGNMAQFLMGNSFSGTPYERVKFTFAATQGGVFVVADPWLEMGMGFGEKKIIPINNNAMRNDLQAGLDSVADYLRTREAGGGNAAIPPGGSAPIAEPCASCAKISKDF